MAQVEAARAGDRAMCEAELLLFSVAIIVIMGKVWDVRGWNRSPEELGSPGCNGILCFGWDPGWSLGLQFVLVSFCCVCLG